MRTFGKIALLIQCTLGCLSHAADDEFSVERSRVVFSYGAAATRSIGLKADRAGPGVVANAPILEPRSRFIRLHFRILNGTDADDWTIEVEPPGKERVVMDIPRGSTDFWSPEIQGGSASVLLSTTKTSTDAEVLIDKVVVSTNVVRPESITTDRRDIVPIRLQTPQIQAWGRSVARLRLVGLDDIAYVCTGFVVGDALMMTNQHCIDDAEVAKSALVDFDFDESNATPKVSRVKAFVFSNYALDYALVELEKQPAGVKALVLSPKSFSVDQDTLVIQHPAGEFKQVSIFNCTVNEAAVSGRRTKSDFGHLCNTLGGSSGSPVMDRSSGTVMGLHHFGFKKGMATPFNQGVLLGQILEDIRAKDALVFKRLNTIQ